MVPQLVIDQINQYVENHTPTGDFVKSVLANDLTMTIVRADPQSRMSLYDIVMYVRKTVPAEARGSYDNIKAWTRG